MSATPYEMENIGHPPAPSGSGSDAAISAPTINIADQSQPNVPLTLSFTHGDNPVAEIEIWRAAEITGNIPALADTIPSDDTAWVDPEIINDGEYFVYQARYKNGITYGPWSQMAFGRVQV